MNPIERNKKTNQLDFNRYYQKICDDTIANMPKVNERIVEIYKNSFVGNRKEMPDPLALNSLALNNKEPSLKESSYLSSLFARTRRLTAIQSNVNSTSILNPLILKNTSRVFVVAASSAAALTILGITVSPLALIGAHFVFVFLLAASVTKLFANNAAEDEPIVKKIQIFKCINKEQDFIKDYIKSTNEYDNIEKVQALQMLDEIDQYLKYFDEQVKIENSPMAELTEELGPALFPENFRLFEELDDPDVDPDVDPDIDPDSINDRL